MEKQLTPLEAWADFIENIYPQIEGRQNRQDIVRALSHERKGLLGSRRIERILTQYAPGRYEFREVVILHNEKSQGG